MDVSRETPTFFALPLDLRNVIWGVHRKLVFEERCRLLEELHSDISKLGHSDGKACEMLELCLAGHVRHPGRSPSGTATCWVRTLHDTEVQRLVDYLKDFLVVSIRWHTPTNNSAFFPWRTVTDACQRTTRIHHRGPSHGTASRSNPCLLQNKGTPATLV